MTEWLARTFSLSPETAEFASLAILGLLGLLVLYVLFRLISGARERRYRAKNARLAVIDAEEVDGRRRLVLVRRDGVEHLLLIGGPSDLVIESGIGAASASRPVERAAMAVPGPTPSSAAREDRVSVPKRETSTLRVETPSPADASAGTRVSAPSPDPVVAKGPTPVPIVPSPSKPAPVKPSTANAPPAKVEPTLDTGARPEPIVPPVAAAAEDPRTKQLDGEIRDLLAQMGRDPGAGGKP